LDAPELSEDFMTARVLQKLLRQNGWRFERQNKHRIYFKEGKGTIQVPTHPGDLAPGLVASILKKAGIKVPD